MGQIPSICYLHEVGYRKTHLITDLALQYYNASFCFFQTDGSVGGWTEKDQEENINALQNIALVCVVLCFIYRSTDAYARITDLSVNGFPCLSVFDAKPRA